MIHPGTGIKALRPAGGNQLHQISVSRLVFAQKDEMGVLPIQLVNLVEPGAGRDINLAADNRFHPGFFRRLIKLDRAIHHAVVGDRHGVLP